LQLQQTEVSLAGHLVVADVILPDTKCWNLPLLTTLLNSSGVNKVLNTPLFNSVLEDKRIWRMEKNGAYSVRSAYRLCVQELLDTSHLRMDGSWNLIWNLKAPPRVRNLLWRICRRCIPTRVNLQSRGVNCTTVCSLCNDHDEDSRHLFFDCSSSKNVWSMCSFRNKIIAALHNNYAASDLIFDLLQQLSNEDASLMACVIWSIWKQRNNRIWNNVIDAQNFVFSRAAALINDWCAVQQARPGTTGQPTTTEIKWNKPANGRVKCNIDASFSSHNNRVGIGVCIRDEKGAYVSAKLDQFSPICDVRVGEALGFLSALSWVHELNLGPVDFELDSKLVIDGFHSNNHDATEFGEIISHCKRLYSSFYVNSSVEFIRRQANEVAHSLAKAATYIASPQVLVDIPNCIEHILINEML
jgi:ribonuclease HI